ncbi:hypothetical protein [Paenibacillus sp. DYY-L-2]|uniref:hypothetical protein n=1 Tax=Paenibacillus sp. DYY-L-2 TaxID=3447013 RepID=UPI003F5054FE
MDREKREIILREIDHWRQGRLLPEHYCDFLENLYRDEEKPASRGLLSLNSIQQGSWKTWLLSFAIISCICFIAIYFSFFAWPLQIAIIFLIDSACYAVSAFYRRKKELFSLVMAGTGSLTMLLLGSWMILLQGWRGGVAAVILIASCAAVWMVAGFMLRFGILEYCGFACLMLLYGLLFRHLHPEASWGLLQLLWLPLAVVFFWLTWFSHHRIKRLSRVLFAISITLWFMPEADSFLLRQQSAHGMELLILLKVMAIFVILFALRKKWVVWLST